MALDVDGDGVLMRREIEEGFLRTADGIDQHDLQQALKLSESPGEIINYSEFLVAGIDRRILLTNRRIEACFRWFDIVN